MDAWMWEAGEAFRLIDDLETKIKNCIPEHLLRITDSAKPKLLELGVKLDRLESLLHNPPSKPVLTLKDIDSRWILLSDIQMRTRVVALTLFAAITTANRSSRFSCSHLQNPADTGETGRSRNLLDQDSMVSIISKEDPELLKPLIFVDATTQSHKQDHINECGLSQFKSCLWKACKAITLIAGVLALLFGLFVLCAIL